MRSRSCVVGSAEPKRSKNDLLAASILLLPVTLLVFAVVLTLRTTRIDVLQGDVPTLLLNLPRDLLQFWSDSYAPPLPKLLLHQPLVLVYRCLGYSLPAVATLADMIHNLNYDTYTTFIRLRPSVLHQLPFAPAKELGKTRILYSDCKIHARRYPKSGERIQAIVSAMTRKHRWSSIEIEAGK